MSEAFDPYRKWLGIPPHEQPPNHYRLLGIGEFEDDLDVIENAANRQMLHVRTFQSGQHSKWSQQILNELSAARICLLNVEKKQAYDAEFHKRTGSPKPAPSRFRKPQVTSVPPAPPAGVRGAPPRVAVEEGPPKPEPVVRTKAPSPIRTNVAPARGRHRRPRRSSPVPMVLGLIAIAVLIGVAVVAMNMDWGSSMKEDAARETAPARRRSALRGNSPRSNTPASTRRSSDTTPSKFPQPGSDTDPGVDTGPPGNASVKPTVPTRESQFSDAVDATYAALASRDWPEATRQLTLAGKFHKTDADNDRVNRLAALKAYLASFWDEVRKAIHKGVEPGTKFTHADVDYELVSSEGDTVTFKVGGTQIERNIRDLSAQHALAFAMRAMAEDDAFARVNAATHLTLDKDAKDIAGNREETLRLLREAAAISKMPNQYVADELGVDPDSLR